MYLKKRIKRSSIFINLRINIKNLAILLRSPKLKELLIIIKKFRRQNKLLNKAQKRWEKK